MKKLALTFTEKFILLLVFSIIATGYILFYTNLSLFKKFVEEDGIVEWLTVVGLILGCLICVGRFTNLRKLRRPWFLFVVLAMGLFLFFAAGEEISWGQRIFGIKSSEYFIEHNSQGETNIHNLIVDGVKLNKVIFSIGLIAAMGVYLTIVPIVYQKNEKIRRWINNSGIPVPKIYQIISIVMLFILTELIPHEKKAEILEAGIALLFSLIIKYPYNIQIFKKDYRR